MLPWWPCKPPQADICSVGLCAQRGNGKTLQCVCVCVFPSTNAYVWKLMFVFVCVCGFLLVSFCVLILWRVKLILDGWCLLCASVCVYVCLCKCAWDDVSALWLCVCLCEMMSLLFVYVCACTWCTPYTNPPALCPNTQITEDWGRVYNCLAIEGTVPILKTHFKKVTTRQRKKVCVCQ